MTPEHGKLISRQDFFALLTSVWIISRYDEVNHSRKSLSLIKARDIWQGYAAPPTLQSYFCKSDFKRHKMSWKVRSIGVSKIKYGKINFVWAHVQQIQDSRKFVINYV